MTRIANYIDGELRSPENMRFIDNINPAIAKKNGEIPASTSADVNEAVNAAVNAFPMWSGLSAEERSKYLLKISELIEENLEELAQAESEDNGKPLALARAVDIPRAASNFRFFATSILHFSSEFHEMGSEAFNYTTRNPLGVAGCISPWNLPLYLFTWKIAPALATGNTVVAKPSELTPLTAFLLSKLCIEAGLPSGVLNIVHGSGPEAGQAIVDHPNIDAISFTGGTSTGKQIASSLAPKFKKLSLELGGKNPCLIFADCDLDAAIENTVQSSFRNQGQICLCTSRLLVEETIYDEFKKKFLKALEKLKIGDPLNEEVSFGALVSEAHMDKVLSYIELAKEEGGILLFGGKREKLEGRCSDGYFVQPTVFEDLDLACRVNQEEIFGPMVALSKFSNEEEALSMANGSQYGLAAVVWTENLNRAHRVADKVESGIVWVNCWMLRDLRTPFGGMKQSGLGREGGQEALRFFTEPKNICIKRKP